MRRRMVEPKGNTSFLFSYEDDNGDSHEVLIEGDYTPGMRSCDPWEPDDDEDFEIFTDLEGVPEKYHYDIWVQGCREGEENLREGHGY